jgi:hypothetical protein
MPWLAFADAESSMIMKQHDESRVGKRVGETRYAMLSGARIAMRHGDCGQEAAMALRHKQPRAQSDASLCLEFDVQSLDHGHLLVR